jgi:hypothetical protein
MNDNDPLGPAGLELHELLSRIDRRSVARWQNVVQRKRQRSTSISQALTSAFEEACRPLLIAKFSVLFGYPLAIAIFLQQLWDHHTLTATTAATVVFAHVLAAIVDVAEREIATVQLFQRRLVTWRPGRLALNLTSTNQRFIETGMELRKIGRSRAG